MSRHTEIADAVADAIRGLNVPEATVTRLARPYVTREQIEAAAQIQVIPSGLLSQAADRSRRRRQYSVDVGLHRAVNPENNAAVDEMLGWLMQIADLFELKRLAGIDGVTWFQTETVSGAEAGYAPEHLDAQQAFTGVLRFTFLSIE